MLVISDVQYSRSRAAGGGGLSSLARRTGTEAGERESSLGVLVDLQGGDPSPPPWTARNGEGGQMAHPAAVARRGIGDRRVLVHSEGHGPPREARRPDVSALGGPGPLRVHSESCRTTNPPA